jgi:hypothetical protein
MKPVIQSAYCRLQSVKEKAFSYSVKSMILTNGKERTIQLKIMYAKDIFLILCYLEVENSI